MSTSIAQRPRKRYYSPSMTFRSSKPSDSIEKSRRIRCMQRQRQRCRRQESKRPFKPFKTGVYRPTLLKGNMPDLRTWLDEVEKVGQLMTIENVHWDLELSTLTELINERSKTRPAVLFDRIKDYPHGYRVAANLVSSVERLALTLGMDAGLSDMDFVQSWRRQVKKISPR